jgi:hypothetical protein
MTWRAHNFTGKILKGNKGVTERRSETGVVGMHHGPDGKDAFGELGDNGERDDLRSERQLEGQMELEQEKTGKRKITTSLAEPRRKES